MRSTFFGLETAKRGLFTQQSALYTTGHNIANANTPGYSRQRVNFTQTEAFPSAAFNSPNLPGQIGSGVQAGSVQRIRQGFLNTQYWGENNQLGYWEARNDAVKRLEEIMNEPSEDGLAKTMDRFWTALQDLSAQPEDSGARSVVRQRGVALADTFNYLHDSISALQKDSRAQLEVAVKEVNSILRQLNNVNKQIGDVEAHGYLPNDLYDERDRLVDQLSQYVNIRVDRVQSDGQPNPMAEGKYNIYLTDADGSVINNVKLVDGNYYDAMQLEVNYDGTESDSPVKSFQFVDSYGKRVDVDPAQTSGKLKAFVEAYGYVKDGTTKGVYNDMMANLDTMAYQYANRFNEIHKAGWNLTDINSDPKIHSGVNFFTFAGGDLSDPKGAAGKLEVSDAIQNELDNIAASAAPIIGNQFTENIGTGNGITKEFTISNPPVSAGTESIYVDGVKMERDTDYTIDNTTGVITFMDPPTNGTGIIADYQSSAAGLDEDSITTRDGDQAFTGDGSNALALANVKNAFLEFDGSTTSVQSFYQGVIGDMGVNGLEAERMASNSETLRAAVTKRRDSVSNVSLDEEMSNMIKFQHAYNAAARQITLVDEMLEKIINGMGRVGR